MANFLKISHKILKEMDFSLKNSIFISKKSGKLIKMQQFNQIFNFLFFVPNFLQKIKKFIKSKKQKFFVFVGSHSDKELLIDALAGILSLVMSKMRRHIIFCVVIFIYILS